MISIVQGAPFNMVRLKKIHSFFKAEEKGVQPTYQPPLSLRKNGVNLNLKSDRTISFRSSLAVLWNKHATIYKQFVVAAADFVHILSRLLKRCFKMYQENHTPRSCF